MVSQPDPAPTSLSLRGPSSVASHRPSLSRTKRYNRSHTGGRSYAPQNEFPVFNNSGDVEIIIKVGPVEQRYLLHRHTLTRSSGFFEASTSQEWSKARKVPALAGGNELTRIGEDPAASTSELNGRGSSNALAGKKRWRYELDAGTDDGDVPMLIQKDPLAPITSHPPTSSSSILGSNPSDHSSSRSSSSRKDKDRGHSREHSASSFFRSVTHLGHSRDPAPAATSVVSTPTTQLSLSQQDLVRDYDNLFRIIYNYHPLLDGVNVADAYVQCKSLLTLADMYDALPIVGPRVDHHLLQFQSRLWKQIAKYPISYLRLGYQARSRIIFQEALIHVVGQWPAGERSLRAALPQVVLDIIEDKVDELEEIIARVDARLFRLSLTNSRGERVAPTSNFLDFLVVSLFRQWVAENTTPTPSPPSSRHSHQHHHSSRELPNRGRAYRTLGHSNPAAYLGHDECKRFLKLSPELYSRDNLRRFEKRMDELKGQARDLVRPLIGSGLELEMGREGGGGIGYLTCTEVGDRDLPWPAD